MLATLWKMSLIHLAEKLADKAGWGWSDDICHRKKSFCGKWLAQKLGNDGAGRGEGLLR